MRAECLQRMNLVDFVYGTTGGVVVFWNKWEEIHKSKGLCILVAARLLPVNITKNHTSHVKKIEVVVYCACGFWWMFRRLVLNDSFVLTHARERHKATIVDTQWKFFRNTCTEVFIGRQRVQTLIESFR